MLTFLEYLIKLILLNLQYPPNNYNYLIFYISIYIYFDLLLAGVRILISGIKFLKKNNIKWKK